ncbi:toll/interleukin-1 receptor domain-containing protein [Aeromonas caviae]|uniref:toll/interleukin-1 receptor domain-containing protein n=1 Tax=Aeromonas caviae TaxID=648 RepID=UPI0015DC3730|nr:toll/interleukin-1 receptor domain-containing protein [Aeromonas caviae]MCR3947762.1 toll/interleukin-1 receptor domain-containing protein [Aeromonas caviae]MDH0317454.1 toll/interleukin-1 receptor domain-containing protein [Aeromonas caviae]MDH1449559.1 toll/interleukin-1 receptor domain-containing protein [Aeromonas caviae]MDH1453445.1 toll/interleukin-1 receptor domain-containing protein [Aeromonas caviae]MDH1496796.1 toll/interleukin-1 receptor domain-containing protein [Aeromonas cavia
MPISQSDLFNAGQRRSIQGQFAKRFGQPTAFLSHSHKDMQLALGLQELLKNQGWDVYIDWQDQTMPDKPDAKTAFNIKAAIVRADWFLFLATQNSMTSRWCPWEIGVADGQKDYDRIAIVPTRDNQGYFYGNEYMNLYNKIDISSGTSSLAFFDTRGNGKWVRNL